jgi:hypothetical protein
MQLGVHMPWVGERSGTRLAELKNLKPDQNGHTKRAGTIFRSAAEGWLL